MNLNAIIQEFDNQNRDDLEIVKAVLTHCSHRTYISFALHCALDIEPLMTNKHSANALRAVELFLKTGAKVPQEVISAAANAAANAAAYAAADAAANAAAYAAYAAANAAAYAADAAANAAAYAADAAANAAAYAANAAAYAANNRNIYKDKMRSYLNKLKELILLEVPANESSWLLAITF